MLDTNNAQATGVLQEEFQFSHESHGKQFYKNVLSTQEDDKGNRITIIAESSLIDREKSYKNLPVAVSGSFNSYNQRISEHAENSRSRLKLFLLCNALTEMACPAWFNSLSLTGTVCKKPAYNLTPRKKKICTLMMAVHRENGNSSYIPCIARNTAALYCSTLPIGTRLQIQGFMHSRKYKKALSEDAVVERTTYEVFIKEVELLPHNSRQSSNQS